MAWGKTPFILNHLFCCIKKKKRKERKEKLNTSHTKVCRQLCLSGMQKELASLWGRRHEPTTPSTGYIKSPRWGVTGTALWFQGGLYLPPASPVLAETPVPGHEHRVPADFFLHLWRWLYPGGLPPSWGRRLWCGECLWGRWKPKYLSFFCKVCLLGVRRGLWGWHELWLRGRGW